MIDIKERIQAKSEELFKKYGIRSITMDEIAGQLGISKKTIYHFYADKDDLVMDVVKSLITFNKAGCAKCVAESENAIHEKILSNMMAKEMFANFNPALMNDLQRFFPVAYKHLETYKREYLLNVISNNIQRGKKEGLYRRQVDADAVALMYLGILSSIMQKESSPKDGMNLLYLEEQLTDFFLHGLATEKGLKMIDKYKHLSEQHKFQTV